MSSEALSMSGVRMMKARSHLLMHKPFFGSLILRLDMGADTQGHPTIWTDGKVLRYSQDYIDTIDFDEMIFALAHCVTKCAQAHHTRRGEREQKLYNDASSYVVNAIILNDRSIPLPKDALYDERFENMSVEQVYSILAREQKQQENQQPKGEGDGRSDPDQATENALDEDSARGEDAGSAGECADNLQERESDRASDACKMGSDRSGKPDNKGDDSACGEAASDREGGSPDPTKSKEKNAPALAPEQSNEDVSSRDGDSSLCSAPGSRYGDVLDAKSGEEEAQGQALSEAELQAERERWETAAVQAAVQAEQAGDSDGGILRMLGKERDAGVSFEQYIRLFVASTCAINPHWGKRSRRSHALPFYLPGQRSESAGAIVIGVDVSGSIDDDLLATFERALQAAHAELRPEKLLVLYVDTKSRAEAQEIGRYDDVAFDRELCKGGGGTRFDPVFKYVDEQREAGERIAGVIYLTDLDAPAIKEAARYELEVRTLWVSIKEAKQGQFGETCYISVSENR